MHQHQQIKPAVKATTLTATTMIVTIPYQVLDAVMQPRGIIHVTQVSSVQINNNDNPCCSHCHSCNSKPSGNSSSSTRRSSKTDSSGHSNCYPVVTVKVLEAVLPVITIHCSCHISNSYNSSSSGSNTPIQTVTIRHHLDLDKTKMIILLLGLLSISLKRHIPNKKNRR